MPFKVCQVVNAHMLIRAGEGLLLDGRSVIQPFQPHLLGQTSMFLNYF